MSYLFIVVIGAIVGYVAGYYIKGSEHGSAIDMAAGALGACVAVALSRLANPQVAAGYLASVIVSVGGVIAALFASRFLLKSKPASVRLKGRRY